jgi:hypothetical protein
VLGKVVCGVRVRRVWFSLYNLKKLLSPLLLAESRPPIHHSRVLILSPIGWNHDTLPAIGRPAFLLVRSFTMIGRTSLYLSVIVDPDVFPTGHL